MNFTEAVNEALGAVKRPDKASTIRREINAAISFYSLDSDFPQDFAEQSIALDAAEFTQSFSLTLLTRFRKFKYLKRGGTKKHLNLMSKEEMEKGCTDRDKYYQAGTAINISLAALAATLDVGYYRYPPVLTGTQTYWMLDIAPYMIIDRACAVAFREIGDERSMQSHMISAREAYLAFRKDQLSAQ